MLTNIRRMASMLYLREYDEAITDKAACLKIIA